MRLYKNNYAVLYRRNSGSDYRRFHRPIQLYRFAIGWPNVNTRVTPFLHNSFSYYRPLHRSKRSHASLPLLRAARRLHLAPRNIILGRKVRNFRSALSETRDAVGDLDRAVRFLGFFKNEATFPLLLSVRWGKKTLTAYFQWSFFYA